MMSRTSRKIGRLMGFPIFVDLTFLLLAGLFIFPSFGNTFTEHFVALMRFPILLGSIILHELGHALVIKRLGYGNSRVLLWGMGGLCINSGPRRKPIDGMKIALAGPGASLALGLPLLAIQALVFGMSPPEGEAAWAAYSILGFAVFVNVGWSIFNLLPIFPLDGGRALMNALRHFGRRDRDKAARLTGLVGLILCIPLGLLCLMGQQLWMVFILFFIGQGSWQVWKRGAVAVGG